MFLCAPHKIIMLDDKQQHYDLHTSDTTKDCSNDDNACFNSREMMGRWKDDVLMPLSSSNASLDVVFIDVHDIFIDLFYFLVDVPGNVDDILDDVLSLELWSPVQYSHFPNDFCVLTPEILPISMLDFSTSPYFAIHFAILAHVSSSRSSELSCLIHHVKKKVKKMNFANKVKTYFVLFFRLSTHSIF